MNSPKEITATEKYHPLTHPQMSIWYSEKLFPQTSMGNIAATLRIFSNVDFGLLEQAINLYVKKNDAFRLRIAEIAGEPRQYISEYQYHQFELLDFKGNLEELFKWDEKQTSMPMDMIESDLFSYVLVKINDHDGGFFVKTHHLISDAWTMALMGNDVMGYYTALKNSEQISGESRPSFLDHLEREKKYQKSSRFQKDKAYWTEKFADWQEMTALKSRKTGRMVSTRARRKTLLIPQKLTAKIHEYCAQRGVSEFSLFLAAIAMYMNRVTDKEDLVFGTTLLNRSNAREKETAGMFANLAVPLRFQIKEEMNFDEFVEQITKELTEVFRHQKYPYDLILKEVRERRGTSDDLFDIVLTYQNSKFMKEQSLEKYITRWHFTGHQIESLIINLNDRENDGRLIIDYDYLVDMFYATEIEFMHSHVISLLWHALDNPVKKISRLEMLSEKEKQKILSKFNETEADFPADKTVQELFEEQVLRSPDNLAVVFREERLTYRELNEKSNQLARVLREKGVKADSIVGILFERSLEMIIAIFAVLKAGGAYLPIDPQYPQDRIKYLLEDGGLKILLTCLDGVSGRELGVEVIDLRDRTLFAGDASNPGKINAPADLAYVIYTSGSTGRPKGVMIEHRGLINRINWMQKKYPLDQGSTILQKTTYTFDVSVWELIWWSFVGAKVCLLEPGGEKDPLQIIKSVEKYRITTMHFVPSMLSSFLQFLEGYQNNEALESLKQVFASGEALTLQQAERFNRLLYSTNGTRLSNLYGPTEAAIDVTSFECSPKTELSSVPIGKPIDNIRLYILDRHLNLLPIGIPGELFIGGVGVSRGYVNKPELTEERFIPNPFVQGEKLYRTGDLVRWYAQGDIEYLGRIDHQIKIRGFRIELGEIENKLQAHPQIKENVVIGLEQQDKKYLCSYYVADEDIPSRELKRFLALSLPEYMVPAFYVRMEALPLSANGKIDRKNLPQPVVAGNQDAGEYAGPRNSLDQELVGLFCGALRIDRIGIDDSFFDLGGDSLAVMTVFAQVYDRNWGISAADFYTYPTIRELSDRIGRREKAGGTAGPDDIEVLEPRPEPENIRELEIEHVLLTGATGFLGAHLLSELIEGTESTVYCLVRAEDDQGAEKRLRENLNFYYRDKYQGLIGKRIIPVKGDISLKRLGFDREEYQRLGKRLDTIVHSAAVVKYFGHYREIEEINVDGTKEICHFACQFGIKLNHISTDAVTGNYLVENPVSCTYTENDFYVGQNYLGNIYVRSKFEAENLVFKAMKRGLKATVFRMGNLTGRYCDGHFQQNIGENAFYRAIRSMVRLGAVSHELLKEEIEFSPVDLSARAVIKIAQTEESDHRVFHIFNHHKIVMQDLVQVLLKKGIPMQNMNKQQMEKLLEDLEEESRNDILSGLMLYLNGTGEIACTVSIHVVSDISAGYLEKLDFQWPHVDQEYLFKIVNYIQRMNYLS